MTSQLHDPAVIELSAEEQALMKRAGLFLQVESQSWLLQKRWTISLFTEDHHCYHSIVGAEHECLSQLHLILAAIGNGIERVQSNPIEMEEEEPFRSDSSLFEDDSELLQPAHFSTHNEVGNRFSTLFDD